jgi:hypothetical protein
MSFADDIIELEHLLRLSRHQLGPHLGLGAGTLRNYTLGKSTKPNRYTAAIVAYELKLAREREYTRLKAVLVKK